MARDNRGWWGERRRHREAALSGRRRDHTRRVRDTRAYKRKEKVRIVAVDGAKIRNTKDIDFTLGGHHYVYPFIPENEVWIEKTLSRSDFNAVAVHEITERERMKYRGQSYEKAHKSANEAEAEVRRKSCRERR